MRTSPGPMRMEVGRKAVHVGMILYPAWIWLAPDPTRLYGLLLAFLLILGIDLLRLGWSPCGSLFDRWVGRYLKPKERKQLTSVHYLTSAALLVSWWTSRPVATVAMSYLVLGDAAAALIGRFFANGHGGSKSLQGSLGCFAVCVLVGWVLLPGQPLAIALGALVATIVERLPLPIDDNLSVPLASALVLSLLVAS